MFNEEEIHSESEAIKVVVRCRPPTEKELALISPSISPQPTAAQVTNFISEDAPTNTHLKEYFPVHCDTCDRTIRVHTNSKSSYNTERTFTFDEVFAPGDSQMDVYDMAVKPVVDGAICGFTGTIFAYGNTGSGKTHTILGDAASQQYMTRSAKSTDKLDLPSGAGMLQRICMTLFESIAQMDCVVELSYLEIYNEELIDLLATQNATSNSGSLRIHAADGLDGMGGVKVTNLTEMDFENPRELIKTICECAERRRTAQTLLNATSSRSHTLCMLTVKERCCNEFGQKGFFKRGRLNVVDLAGSENIGKSGATAQNQREAGNINQSLLALGRVITALNEGAPHIPYRESKLTRLLQDSLGGSTRTVMIANIGPAVSSVSETLNTLTYAGSVRKIQNRPVISTEFIKNVLNQKEMEVNFLKERLAAVRQYLAGKQVNSKYVEKCKEANEKNSSLLKEFMSKVHVYMQDMESKSQQMERMIETKICDIGKDVGKKLDELVRVARDGIASDLERERSAMVDSAGECFDPKPLKRACEELYAEWQEIDAEETENESPEDSDLMKLLNLEEDKEAHFLFEQDTAKTEPKTPSKIPPKTPTRPVRKQLPMTTPKNTSTKLLSAKTPGSMKTAKRVPGSVSKSRVPIFTPKRNLKMSLESVREMGRDVTNEEGGNEEVEDRSVTKTPGKGVKREREREKVGTPGKRVKG